MTTIANQPPQPTWREQAIERSQSITDAWEVTKTYAGRLAEWILFLCMIVYIVEIVPGVALWPWVSNTVLGIQAVTLDVGGLALASMAGQAREHGHLEAARQADRTGKALIGIVILTLTLITVGLLYPPAKTFTDGSEKVLILLRVCMTVVYGHVVHTLRKNTEDAITPTQVVTLEQRLARQAERIEETAKEQTTRIKEVTDGLNDLASAFDSQKQETLTEVQYELAALQHGAQQREQILLANLKGLQDALPAMVQAQSHVIIAEVEGQFRQALAGIPAAPTYDEPLQQMREQIEVLAVAIESLKVIEKEEEEEEESEPEGETNITDFEAAKVHLLPPPPETKEVPKPRITAPLSAETKSAPKRETQGGKKRASANGRKTAQEKAQLAIKRNPNITAAELAKKAKCTPQYASRILKQMHA